MLGRKGNALTWGERKGPKNTYPSSSVDDVVVLGNGTVSTQAIRLLLENDVPLHYVSGSGKYLGSLTTAATKKGKMLRKKQEEAAGSQEKCIPLARGVVVGKILNQRKNLIRATYRNRKTKAITESISRLEFNAKLAGSETDIDALRGIEGVSAAAYFYSFEDLLAPGWTFRGRNRRPPKDPVNAMLSFTYTLLLNTVVSAVLANQLDPCIGFLHGEYRGRPSVALDLMEEFRPSISDRVVIALINQGMISQNDFESDGDGGIKMKPGARRVLVEAYSARLSTSCGGEDQRKPLTYRERIYSQARAMSEAIWLGHDYLPFVVKK